MILLPNCHPMQVRKKSLEHKQVWVCKTPEEALEVITHLATAIYLGDLCKTERRVFQHFLLHSPRSSSKCSHHCKTVCCRGHSTMPCLTLLYQRAVCHILFLASQAQTCYCQPTSYYSCWKRKSASPYSMVTLIFFYQQDLAPATVPKLTVTGLMTMVLLCLTGQLTWPEHHRASMLKNTNQLKAAVKATWPFIIS